MNYIGTLTIDYSGTRDGNNYQRILNALHQAGWSYAETSAMYVEADDLDPFLLGLEVLARTIDSPGTLSALSVQIQLVGPRSEPPAATNHRHALEKVLKERALPSTNSD